MTTVSKIGTWFDDGVRQGASHMLIVWDTFSDDDYPVYVEEYRDGPSMVKQAIEHYSGNMQKVVEVYNLAMPKEEQLQPRKLVWNT